eukprot:m.67963 g.67963  ORF g.67963 m.67963 type:complete len:215 (+) comp15974_c0_seq1:357-1001(+)
MGSNSRRRSSGTAVLYEKSQKGIPHGGGVFENSKQSHRSKSTRIRARKPKRDTENLVNESSQIPEQLTSALASDSSSDSDNGSTVSVEWHSRDEDVKDVESDSCSSPNWNYSKTMCSPENVEVITFDDCGQIGSVVVETATGKILVTGKPQIPEPLSQITGELKEEGLSPPKTEHTDESKELREICDRLEMVLFPYWKADRNSKPSLQESPDDK